MASGGDSPNLWDADHKDGKEVVISHKTYHQLLMGNFMALLGKLEFSPCFWTHLLDRRVVDERMKTKIQGLQTREAQVLKLVDHIVNSEVYKFHGFAWAIVNSKQFELAKELGFHLTLYLDESDFLKTSSFICPGCSEFNTKSYILPECGHFVCSPCVKGAQFICKDNKQEDITCPVPECGKISETDPGSKSSIGLKGDATYTKLCKLVKDQAQVEKKNDYTPVQMQPKEALSNVLKRKGSDISAYKQKYRKYTDTVANSDQRLRNYIEETSKRIMKWVEDWREEQEKFIKHAKQEVQTKHAEGVQWEKVISDLTIMSNACPWKLDKIELELVETSFPKLGGAAPAVVSYVEQLLSGSGIPKTIVLPRHVDTHATAKVPMTIDTATLICEWSSSAGRISDLDLYEDQVVLGSHGRMYSMLKWDLASESWVKVHNDVKCDADCVYIDEDEKIYVGHKGLVKINFGKAIGWHHWEISIPDCQFNTQKLIVAANAKHVVVSSAGGKIAIFDQQRKYQHQINMPFVTRMCICNDTLVVVAQGVHLINLKTMTQLYLPAGLVRKGNLESPCDVAPFGKDHFLVYDMKPGLLKVFTLMGDYLHTLAIQDKTGKTLKLNSEEHASIATYPKEGTPTRLAVGCGSELKVYSLS